MSRFSELQARTRVVEKSSGADETGLTVWRCLVRLGMYADRHVPVIAVEVTRGGERVTVAAQPGEGPDDLFRRAAPSGSWRARAKPICGRSE